MDNWELDKRDDLWVGARRIDDLLPLPFKPKDDLPFETTDCLRFKIKDDLPFECTDDLPFGLVAPPCTFEITFC